MSASSPIPSSSRSSSNSSNSVVSGLTEYGGYQQDQIARRWLREEWEKLNIATKRLALQEEKLVLDKEMLRAEKKTLRTQQILYRETKVASTATNKMNTTKKNNGFLSDSSIPNPRDQRFARDGAAGQKAGDSVQEQTILHSDRALADVKEALKHSKNSQTQLQERVRSLEEENQRLRDEKKGVETQLDSTLATQTQIQQQVDSIRSLRDSLDPQQGQKKNDDDSPQSAINWLRRNHEEQQQLISELKITKQALLEQQVRQTRQLRELEWDRDKVLQELQHTKQNLEDKILEASEREKEKQKLENDLNESKLLVDLNKNFLEASKKKKAKTQNDLESLQQFYAEQQEVLKETREALLDEKVIGMGEIQRVQDELDIALQELQDTKQALKANIEEKKHLERQRSSDQQELTEPKILIPHHNDLLKEAQKNYEQLNDDLVSLQMRRDEQKVLLAEVQGTHEALAATVDEHGSPRSVQQELRVLSLGGRTGYLNMGATGFVEDISEDEAEEYIEEIVYDDDKSYFEIVVEDEDVVSTVSGFPRTSW